MTQHLGSDALVSQLDSNGWAVRERLLSGSECHDLIGLFDDDARFRKHVDMTAQGYGKGEYKYFTYPLPELVAALRTSLYEVLAPIANRWNESLRYDVRFPATHAEFIARCQAAGQQRPTPLLLRYRAGDYNNLHQDVYGEHVFPLQVAVLLSEPLEDFTGGELVLVEEQAGAQSRVCVVPLRRGDAVIFAVRERPVNGARATMRHGVSPLRSGHRTTLGIILHDAK